MQPVLRTSGPRRHLTYGYADFILGPPWRHSCSVALLFKHERPCHFNQGARGEGYTTTYIRFYTLKAKENKSVLGEVASRGTYNKLEEMSPTTHDDTMMSVIMNGTSGCPV